MRLTNRFQEVSSSDVILLDNTTCPYCGIALTAAETTKEHVIGRRFIPRGKLDKHWNLIVNACNKCNGGKSDLENDISAITMQPNISGKYAVPDPKLAAEARRKGLRSYSRKTQKPVDASVERIKLEVPLGIVGKATVEFVAPPQIDDTRLYELCRLQLSAFFYWNTYNHESRTGGFWLGGFHPLLEAPRSDWGNATHRGFMGAVRNWEPRVLGHTADGYFRVITRRHPTAECWSWALEWNHNYRIVGFFGDRAVAQALVDTFPKLERRRMVIGPAEWIAIRMDQPLDESQDLLFEWDSAGNALRE